jgi:hypothetical protein
VIALSLATSPARGDYIDSSGINHLTSTKANQWPQAYVGTWCGDHIPMDADFFMPAFYKPDEKGNCESNQGVLTIEKDHLTFDRLIIDSPFELTRVSCQFKSVKPRFDRKAPNSTHTEGNMVIRIDILCEDVDNIKIPFTLELVIYKGRDLWAKNLIQGRGR